MEIAGNDLLSRTIFHPQMQKDEGQVVFKTMFEFPDGQPESVIWRNFKPLDSAVHELGVAMQKDKRSKGKNATYMGFGTAKMSKICQVGTNIDDGFGFELKYAPAEGDHHVHVEYKFAVGKTYANLNRARKQELKFSLCKLFSSSITDLKS